MCPAIRVSFVVYWHRLKLALSFPGLSQAPHRWRDYPGKQSRHDHKIAPAQATALEEYPAVQLVQGRFMFVYIPHCIDCNRQVGRLLTNVTLASGG